MTRRPATPSATALRPDPLRAIEVGGEAIERQLGRDPGLLWARTQEGETPLHLVARRGRADDVAALLRAGAEVDARTTAHEEVIAYTGPIAWGGATSLHLAAHEGHAEVVARLLAAGADPAALDVVGATPLEHAVGAGALGCARLLLDAGADVNLGRPHDETPLHGAVVVRKPDLVRLLLSRGADPSRWRHDGQTPLHRCLADDQVELAALLLDAGAERDARDRDGRTPLHAAAYSGGARVVALLLGRGRTRGRRTGSGSRRRTSPSGRPRPWRSSSALGPTRTRLGPVAVRPFMRRRTSAALRRSTPSATRAPRSRGAIERG